MSDRTGIEYLDATAALDWYQYAHAVAFSRRASWKNWLTDSEAVSACFVGILRGLRARGERATRSNVFLFAFGSLMNEVFWLASGVRKGGHDPLLSLDELPIHADAIEPTIVDDLATEEELRSVLLAIEDLPPFLKKVLQASVDEELSSGARSRDELKSVSDSCAARLGLTSSESFSANRSVARRRLRALLAAREDRQRRYSIGARAVVAGRTLDGRTWEERP